MKINRIGLEALALSHASAATRRDKPIGGTQMRPGPNADYVFAEGSTFAPLSVERYSQYVAPLLAQRFPHLGPGNTNRDVDMTTGLSGTNIRAFPFPKSFMDALFVTFYLQDEAALTALGPVGHVLSYLTHSLQDGAVSASGLDNKSIDQMIQASLVSLQHDMSAKVRQSLLSLTGQSLLGVAKIRATPCDRPLTDCVTAPLLKHETSVHHHTAVLSFNNRALRFFAEQGIDLEIVAEDSILNIAETICEQNARHFWERRGQLTFSPNDLSQTRTKERLLAAIRHEINAPPNTYSLFRSGHVGSDGVEVGGAIRCSLSFGSSALMGWLFDGISGCAVGDTFTRGHYDFYALDVDVDKWLTNVDDLRNHVYITGMRGPARSLSAGEYLHPRLRPPPADIKNIWGIEADRRRDSSYYAPMFVNSTDSEASIVAASRAHFDSMKCLLIPAPLYDQGR
jgi:hypothetical protein